MSSQRPLANGENLPQPDLYSSFLLSAFFTFRLLFIPTFTLTHAAHGPLWISLVLGLGLTFGGEWLAQRRSGHVTAARRDLLVVAASLFLIGLFPAETPVQLILWAGIGLAWGAYRRSQPTPTSTSVQWIGYALGAAIGLTGLIGPGSWMMALLLSWPMVKNQWFPKSS